MIQLPKLLWLQLSPLVGFLWKVIKVMFQTTNQKSNDSATQIAMVTTITPGWISMESHV